MRGAAALVLAGLALAAAGRAAAAPPADPAEVAAFAARDLEGRWAAYAAAPEPLAAWVAFLAERKDVELLEALAITTRTLEALDALERLDAPGWVRCAFWRLTSSDSHALDAARGFVLDRRPGAVLDWLDRHPAAERGPGAVVGRALRGREPAVPREDAGRYLPPLDPEVVLGALVPPARLVAWAPGAARPEGARWTHEVLRALDAWSATSLRSAPYPARLAALLDRGEPEVVRAAALACAALATADLPLARLGALLDDPAAAPAVRAAAVLTLAAAGGEEGFVRGFAVATDPGHPAWSAAASRMADVGDEGVADVLAALGVPEGDAARLRDDVVARLRAAAAADPDGTATARRVDRALRRAAWAAERAHPTALTLGAAAVGLARARRAHPEVAAALDRAVAAGAAPGASADVRRHGALAAAARAP